MAIPSAISATYIFYHPPFFSIILLSLNFALPASHLETESSSAYLAKVSIVYQDRGDMSKPLTAKTA